MREQCQTPIWMAGVPQSWSKWTNLHCIHNTFFSPCYVSIIYHVKYLLKKRVTITLEFLSPQYKVLSVLPGSGMGISVATPSTQKVVKSSQIDLYCTFHNTQCFKAALQKNHDDNVYNILRSSCLIVAFSRLDLEDNIIYILRLCKQSSSWDIGYYIVYIAPWVYCTYADKIKVKIHLVSFYSDITLCLVALI